MYTYNILILDYKYMCYVRSLNQNNKPQQVLYQSTKLTYFASFAVSFKQLAKAIKNV